MTALQVFEGEAPVAAGGRAVEDQPVHLEHGEGLCFHITQWLGSEGEPVGGAGLDGHGAEDRGYHCSDEFQHLRNGAPIDFNHFHTDLVNN